jgi:hypothetical protein
MATVANQLYDQLSASLGETFRRVVDDNVFGSNMVFQKGWQEGESMDEGRFLALPIAIAKNQTAMSFGQFDEVDGSPQTLTSAASFPWSFYVATVSLDYQTLRLVRGKNMRVDQVVYQVNMAIASLADTIGIDLTNLSKNPGGPTAFPAFGIVEASDDGGSVNVYGNIVRQGAGAFVNWQGNVVRTLLSTGIGTPANDAPLSLFYAVFTNSTQGAQSPTEVYSTKQGIAAYMFALQPLQRLAPMDTANAGYAKAMLFTAEMWSDDHIQNPVNAGKIGVNYFLINRGHTKFFYPGRRGFDFIDWNDAPTTVSKKCRYVTCFQMASSQPRTGGQLLNVNSVQNL